MAPRNEAEREILVALQEAGAVNFEAIGAAIAKFGPSAALNMDYEEDFCGTMRNYVRVLHLVGPTRPMGDLSQLRQIGGELNR